MLRARARPRILLGGGGGGAGGFGGGGGAPRRGGGGGGPRRGGADAPPGSWGRPIGALKALVLAGDWDPAHELARWPLEAGAATAESPIGRYAAALALLVLGRDHKARHVASTIRDRDDFPPAVADALTTIAAGDRAGYLVAVEDVLESFEQREEFLEEMPVADTVLVLQALAERRDLAVDLPASDLLP